MQPANDYTQTLPESLRHALGEAQRFFGRHWRYKLLSCWATASYPEGLRSVAPDLQHFRNSHGPQALLRKVRFEPASTSTPTA